MKAPIVTRTFTTTNATLLCLDTEAAEPINRDVELAGHFDSEDKILKAAKKLIETDTLVVCKLVHCTEETTLRGMTVQKFLENSDVIDKNNANEEN